MAHENKRRSLLAATATTCALVLVGTFGGASAVQAAPSHAPAHAAQGRAANAAKAEKAIRNGSGRITEVAPVDGTWMNRKLPADKRADLLMAKMTLEEKVSRLHGEFSGETAFYIAPLARLGIPALLLTDAGSGVRVTNAATNDGKATALPAPIALGATWDTAMASAYGDVLGKEVRATGQNGLLGPTGDLVRDPRWGRQFEALGEDPALASALIGPEIKAVQSHDVVATIKHPAVYNEETSRLNDGNVTVSERALRETYLAPIEASIKAGVGSAMCSFNKVNTVYACESAEVFDILKKSYGFKGFIRTDYGAAHSTVAAANSGLDVEFPAAGYFGQPLIDAVNNGQVSRATVDDKVHRVLRTMFAMGSFDRPVGTSPLTVSADRAAARQIAEKSAVLLKNSAVKGTASRSAVLPLNPAKTKSVAVIGADADALATGGGSSVVKPTASVTPLAGIKKRLGSSAVVSFTPGTDPVGPAHSLSGAAVPSSVMAPASDPTASGLKAEYWFGRDTSGTPNVTRTDKQVALSAGFLAIPGLYGSSVPAVPGYNFGGPLSARWTGTITAPADGAYTLSLTGFGSSSLFLDGKQIIDGSDPHAVRTDTGATLRLAKGEAHELRVEYTNDATDPDQESSADLVMTWTHPSQVVVPAVAKAVAAAKAASVAVVFARDYVGEGRDKKTLTLANEQDALIAAVTKANPRTVVVLTTSGSVNMPWLASVPSVLEAWYGGQEQGTAIARVLFGDVNPSGKLPVTFAKNDAATPTSAPASFPGLDRTATVDGVNIGYQAYRAAKIAPQFAFGTGLSYTKFGYSKFAVATSKKTVTRGAPASVTAKVRVTNSGTRTGTETAQVYVGTLPSKTVATSPQKLAGFAKVTLRPGQSKTITVKLNARAFAYWNSAKDVWATPTGKTAVSVGSSSADIRQQAVAVLR
ncbi:glycoside hydrolase family 3 C-terminal domain-containing protein [Frondihabitans sp. 4ASC-45]|uniref:glycoside hydrolase family 3 protein n=1 Tax=Frondihabitans sp. 4ASC-45 TaxID=3111636 RepID=UPI003C1C2747